MSFKLRYYQEDAVSHTFDYINKGGRAGIAVLPTASGKSIVIAEIVKRILTAKNHVRIMMLTHVKELIEQNFEKLKSIWPTAPAGIYSAGVGFRQFQYPIIFGGIQSCYRKPKIFKHIDMIIVDEAHLISDNAESMYGSFIAALKEVNPNLVVIGLTATPYRLGMGYLTYGPIFDDIYYDISTLDNFVRLIDEGYLCDLLPVKTDNEYDLSNVKKIAGDFSEKSLDENINLNAITQEIVFETMKWAKDRNKGIAFCVSISHAKNMARMFKEQGYRAAFIHGKMNKKEREIIMNGFRSGEINMLTNVGVATTGLDVPDIDFMVIARPTQSTALHVQIMGRGMRVHPSKKNTLVLDFAGNTERLGPVNDPIIPIPGKKGKGEAPIRICVTESLKSFKNENGEIEKPLGCGAINHASVRFCKNCGAQFVDPVIKISAKTDDSDLIKRGDVPKYKLFSVDHVSAMLHTSQNGNIVVKITFVCEKQIFDKYLMLDKNSKGYYPSLAFFEKFKFDTIPETCKEAVDLINSNDLKKPRLVNVWTNKPIPGKKRKTKEVRDIIYDE